MDNAQDKISFARFETEETDDKSDVANNNHSINSESSSDEEDGEDKAERQSKAAKRKLKKQKWKENRKNKNKNNVEKQNDNDNLKEVLKKEEKNAKEADRLLKMGDRKRSYNSMYEAKAPTTEEIEAYQMKRKRDEEDPIVHFH